MKFSTFAAAVAMSAALASTAAGAAILILPAPGYSGSATVNPDGTLSYDPVVQQDKTWSNFSSTGLAGSSVSFLFSHVGLEDYHTISIGLPSLAAGDVVTFNYTIAINPSNTYFLTALGDIGQNVGSSTLYKTITDNNGNPYIINFTKDDGSIYTGTQSVNLLPGATILTVQETFTVGVGGSNAASLQNTFVQGIPEPSTWAMMGLGFVGLAFAGYRSRKSVAAVA